MAQWRILDQDYVHYVEVTLNNEAVRTEAGAMHYYQGNIRAQTKMPSVGGFIKSRLSGERAFRPVYEGTGKIMLEPSFKSFHIIRLAGEKLILDRGAYWASDMGVQVDAQVNKAMTGLFSGEGLIQTAVSGSGHVIVQAPGPLKEVVLNNDRLVVDGSFAVARSEGLKFSVQTAEKGMLGSITGGEILVNSFEGSGTVWLAPIPNRSLLVHELMKGTIYGALAQAKKGS